MGRPGGGVRRLEPDRRRQSRTGHVAHGRPTLVRNSCTSYNLSTLIPKITSLITSEQTMKWDLKI